jgi:hypothetical protein
MRLTILPFFSQQDKRTGQFLLDSCGATKQARFLLERVRSELGWSVRVGMPANANCDPFDRNITQVCRLRIPESNPLQSLHWDVFQLAELFRETDIAICNHELMAIPVRALFPKMRIVQMCSVDPRGNDWRLFEHAWSCADLVVAQGEYAKKYFSSGLADEPVRTHTSVWPLAFDEARFTVLDQNPLPPRDIDILFVNRCSATNYTHHEELLACDLRPYKMVYTDPTCYLRTRRPELAYCTHKDYLRTLYSSRVAIALNDNLYGGLSIREAIRAGCVPVVLDAPCYRELVGEHWPFLVGEDLSNLESIVRDAVKYSKSEKAVKLPSVAHESYQAGWPKVKADLQELAK